MEVIVAASLGDALLIVVYILNKVSYKSVTLTPYKLWSGKKPDVDNLRTWGSAAYIHDILS